MEAPVPPTLLRWFGTKKRQAEDLPGQPAPKRGRASQTGSQGGSDACLHAARLSTSLERSGAAGVCEGVSPLVPLWMAEGRTGRVDELV